MDRTIAHLRQQLAEVHYSLGLLKAEDEKRLAEAAESLDAAAKLMPGNPRVHYNLGLARQKLGQTEAAEASLLAACRLAPDDPELVKALAIFYAQQRAWRKAIAAAEQHVRVAPADPEARALLELIRRESQGLQHKPEQP